MMVMVPLVVDAGRVWLWEVAAQRPLHVRKAARALRMWDALFYSSSWIAKPVLAKRALATVIDNGWPGFGIGAHPVRLRLSWASALTPHGHATGPKRINREAVENLLQTFVKGGYDNGIGIALLVL
jgi:hypothetical protein